ncbi:4Fe-4S domain-containing protein [Patescibacteria group bacterium]
MDDQNQQLTQDNNQAPPSEETPQTPQEETTPTPQPEAPAEPATGDQGEVQVMTIGKYEVKIINNLCIGAASCIAVSPGVYKLDENNIAIFLDGATDTEENLLASAQSCPTKAIEIKDTETGQQVWPQ